MAGCPFRMSCRPSCDRRRRTLVIATAAVLLCLVAPSVEAAVKYAGVNLAGADFGESALPGTYNVNYTYPTAAEVDYFLSKGMNTFRVPFRWERLQQSLGAPFNAAELGRLTNIVDYATDHGAYVVLDPHNYARYHGSVIGGSSVTNADFGDFWSRLASEYKDNDRVIFGLMNEPNSMPTEQWLAAANEAIASIRAAGATNLILVPGNAWSGAHSWNQNWYGTPNAVAMLDIVDPADNFAFDVHQYLDGNSSGTSSTVVSATIGAERLQSFTKWLKDNDRRGFLGEFAVANSTIGPGASQIGDNAISNMLDFIRDNDDVWIGWTWWAAGPWWGDYQFTLEPTNLGQPTEADRPALAVLEPFVAEVTSPLVQGDYNNNGTIDAADYTVWRDLLGQSGAGLAADGTGPGGMPDGVVDQLDFLLWKTNFGATSSGAEANAASPLPEPTSTGVMLIALLTVPTAARYRSRGCRRSSMSKLSDANERC